MSVWFYLIMGLFIISLIFCSIKLMFIKKSVKDIKEQINSILRSDTNNLITISSSDKDVKDLAECLNVELKELRNQRLQYENGNQELKKSITNISHDIRTPLTAIRGYIDLIKNEKEDNKKDDYLKIIDRKTKDLTGMIEQLFDYSKAVDLGIKIEKQRYCLNELLEETLANYYIIFKENNIMPSISITEEKIYKDIDKNAITRVFENILSNIIKYSNGDFKVSLNNDGKIIFSNQATSLDATTVKKIFDRYYTVENAKKSTGLGLSIAKKLIELNGGTINAKYAKSYLIIEINI